MLNAFCKIDCFHIIARYVSSGIIKAAQIAAFVITALFAASPAHSQTPSSAWFLQAGASGDGMSAASPIGSAAMFERSTRPGDTVILLSSDVAFDGGLKLKAGQTLIGVPESGRKPVITNTDSIRNGGCGIVLADDNRIWNVRIEDTAASGIYGLNISNVRIYGVEVHGANRSQSFVDATYPTLPGSLPHGGMVFIHSEASAQVQVSSSVVTDSAGFGIASVTSDSVTSRLSVSHTRVEGGSRIGFFDAGISALVRDIATSVRLDVSDSEVRGRLSRSGRNVMVVASGGAHADARFERFWSGPTGQDGIVAAVMQSPSEINLYIGDSLIEDAGQMNIEGTLVNLPPDDPSLANQGQVSIEIEGSTIRRAGSVSGFEEVAANIWLGASQFLEDQPPAVGKFKLVVRDSRVEAAGRSGFEFGDLQLLNEGHPEQSQFEVTLRGNTIVGNGKAEVMIYAPHALIDARGNCWGQPAGLTDNRITIRSPAKAIQLDATKPIICNLPGLD